MKLKFFGLVFFTFIASPSSFAYLAKSNSEIASGYVAQHFEIQGEISKPEDLHLSAWNLSASTSRTKEENETTGEITYANTRGFSGGFDIGYDPQWLLALNVDSSRTSETEYSQTVTGAEASYTSSPIAEYGWSWNAGAGYYQGDIKQHLSFQILNTRIERDVALNQRETQVFFGLSPIKELSLQFRASFFTYSKSKQDLRTAFQNRFLNTYTGDLISSIASLPESQFKLSATYQISDLWDAAFNTSLTKHIVDDSTSRRGEITATRYWSNWRLGAGLGRTLNENRSDFSALLDLGYSWD